MHPIVLDFVSVVAETRYGQKCDAVVRGVIRHPGGSRIPKLDLSTEDELVPLDHFIEAAGLDRDVMQCRFNHRHDSSLRRALDRFGRSCAQITQLDIHCIRWQKRKCDSKMLSPLAGEKP